MYSQVLFFPVRWGFCAVLAGAMTMFAACDGGGDGGSSNDFGDNNPKTVVCIGDSITGEVNYPGVPPYPAELKGMKPDLTVVIDGIGSSETREGAGRIGGDLQRNKPGYVCILYGAIDIIVGTSRQESIANLRSMIQQAKNNKTVPLLATLTPMSGSHSIFQGGVVDLNNQIRSLADSEGVALVDLASEFGGDAMYARFPDGIHPDAMGCTIIAMAFSEKID